MDKRVLWKTVLAQLEVDLSPVIFKTWFKNTRLLNIKDGIAEIGCPAYGRHRLEERYYSQIKRALNNITGDKNELVFRTALAEPTSAKGPAGPLFEPPSSLPSQTASGISPNYTFDSFIVGANNNLAHAVAQAIVEKPGRVYNPFFLYSGVGLGKTHLIQAIGNAVGERERRLKVLYCTGESFANELIDAIQSGRRSKSEAFRQKFRNSDVWLIDDVQFIAGREATQEEFFHTFNSLYLSQKQIVLTSDRPPSEIAKLEARLSSRFGGGMIADMQPPDLDVRVAILRRKRDQTQPDLDDKVVDAISERIDTNIRDLEGAFLQVIAASENQDRRPSVGLVEEVLKHNRPAPTLNPQAVIKQVCRTYALKPRELSGPRRHKDLALARQVAMFLLRRTTKMSLNEVGEILGGRDHTTIIHGVDKIENLLQRDIQLRKQVQIIRSNLH